MRLKPLKPLSALGDRWHAWWFGDADPYRLAAFRVLFGAYLFCYFVELLPHVDLTFSTRGVYVPYLIPDLAMPPLLATLVYLAFLGSIAAFTVGYRTRLATPLVFTGYLYFYFLNLAVKNTSYDRLNLIFLLVLCLAPADGAWSVSRPRPERGAAARGWAVRLIGLQVALLYFGAGLWKLTAPPWHDPEMLRMTLAGTWGTPLGIAAAGAIPLWLFGVLNWSVIGLELAMPLLLVVRRTRTAAFAAGFAFHLANWIFLGLPEFMNVVTTYVVFADPRAVRAWGDRLLLGASRRLAALAGVPSETARLGTDATADLPEVVTLGRGARAARLMKAVRASHFR